MLATVSPYSLCLSHSLTLFHSLFLSPPLCLSLKFSTRRPPHYLSLAYFSSFCRLSLSLLPRLSPSIFCPSHSLCLRHTLSQADDYPLPPSLSVSTPSLSVSPSRFLLSLSLAPQHTQSVYFYLRPTTPIQETTAPSAYETGMTTGSSRARDACDHPEILPFVCWWGHLQARVQNTSVSACINIYVKIETYNLRVFVCLYIYI
ncbi:uncharacterized protein LOC122295766 [Carya illinoinensis]|uniref:uncharacterized protein LOC122295766 n=1 Tax=Carya illinoinensis TaxID=32201 RepID=UPI001C7278EF|nr:uncharacterized protein LOC122295766 [Carya illinoinensis]